MKSFFKHWHYNTLDKDIQCSRTNEKNIVCNNKLRAEVKNNELRFYCNKCNSLNGSMDLDITINGYVKDV